MYRCWWWQKKDTWKNLNPKTRLIHRNKQKTQKHRNSSIFHINFGAKFHFHQTVDVGKLQNGHLDMFLNTKLQLNVPERSSQPNLHSAMAHRAKMSPPPGTCASVPCMACNQPHPLEHTTDNPPAKPTMKGIPAYGLLVKVAFRGVLKQP